jgi:hypothetical protein
MGTPALGGTPALPEETPVRPLSAHLGPTHAVNHVMPADARDLRQTLEPARLALIRRPMVKEPIRSSLRSASPMRGNRAAASSGRGRSPRPPAGRLMRGNRPLRSSASIRRAEASQRLAHGLNRVSGSSAWPARGRPHAPTPGRGRSASAGGFRSLAPGGHGRASVRRPSRDLGLSAPRLQARLASIRRPSVRLIA